MIAREHITGLVLAGGRGSRMGGVDKGLENFEGQPLALRAAWRLMPQVGELLINANRNLGPYEAFGFPVIPDAMGDYQGPLAGVMAGLEACTTDYLATVPCDSPFFPMDLVPRLAQALHDANAQLSVAMADGRAQPVFMVMRADVLESLRAFLDQGGRKIDRWTASLHTVDVDFGATDPAFVNVNSREELFAAQAGSFNR
ncbi:MAG TPA: molybdenum cofactor guanylyltransferase MobA [Burkholderiaceae bacterium]|nr:molybdenum cofactor guanylyltransferase MobA [Burkholderiaceae bacterium]